METFGDISVTKTSKTSTLNFECKSCNYVCSKKYNWVRHISTPKHLQVTVGDVFGANNEQNEQITHKYLCEYCNKNYDSRNGLWKHKKKCNFISKQDNYNEPTDKELIMMLIKENSEMKNMMMDQQNIIMKVVENGTTNHSHNTTTTNSHNKAFNLQFFLNETCKDAMNIMDFVESIQLQLSDLENVGKVGYVEGITNIITKNLKALDVTKRPIHCTDKKREVLYIRDENKWEKEDDNKKRIRKAIKRVASRNHRLILKFKEAHPDCLKASSNYSDQYNKIIIESCGGSGDNDNEKEDKIIRNITKNVIVDKLIE